MHTCLQMYRIRCLTPQLGDGMLYPPSLGSAREAVGSPNLLLSDVDSDSALTKIHIRTQHQPGQHSSACRVPGSDRGPNRSGRLPLTATDALKEQGLELASMPQPVTRDDEFATDGVVSCESRAQMQHVGCNITAKPVQSVVALTRANKGCRKVLSSTSPEPKSCCETGAAEGSLRARDTTAAPATASPPPSHKRRPSRVKFPSRTARSGGGELLGSPDGGDSLITDQSLLDMNTEDPFKAGEGVHANPPHSSPYAQSPIATPDIDNSTHTIAAEGMFWSQVEHGRQSNVISEGKSITEPQASAPTMQTLPCDVPPCSITGSPEDTPKSADERETLPETDAAAGSTCENPVSVPSSTGFADNHRCCGSDVSSYTSYNCFIDGAQERTRGGGEGGDLSHDESGVAQRRKWSRASSS